MNEKLLEQFVKLLSYIDFKIKEFKKNDQKKEANIYGFKQRQIKRVVEFLKNYPEKITKSNYNDLIDIDGIGKGTIERIKEILETGKLSELKDFETIYKENNIESENKIIDELMEVINMGPSKAKEFYDMGIKSVADLKKKIKDGKIEVNDKIALGLKYHGIIKTNIPRKEIDTIFEVLKKIIKKINKKNKFDEKEEYIIEICGSYRREKATSNDIDVLITKKGKDDSDINHLKSFVKKLKKEMKENNNKPLLIDDMTDKKIETKYMGFLKYKNNPVRRIDIRYIPYESYHYALLYFTGSKDLNKKMRQIAKNKGYTLSEYDMIDKEGNSFKAKSEKDIFKKLGMEYLPPRLR
mgnify:CR=1 FL=1